MAERWVVDQNDVDVGDVGGASTPPRQKQQQSSTPILLYYLLGDCNAARRIRMGLFRHHGGFYLSSRSSIRQGSGKF